MSAWRNCFTGRRSIKFHRSRESCATADLHRFEAASKLSVIRSYALDRLALVPNGCLHGADQSNFISHIVQKTGILLGIDSKTVWTYWKGFQLHGLSDAPTGQPSILTDEQLDRVTEFAVKQLYYMQPVTCASLAWFIRS
jgi:hypothetical protein